MANRFFANGVLGLAAGTFDLVSSTLRAVLINSTGNANLQFDTYDNLNDIQANTWQSDDKAIKVSTGNTIVGADDDVRFGSGSQVLTFTTVAASSVAKGILIFHSNATRTTSRLICFCSFASAVTTGGGSVTVTLSASGFGEGNYA